MQGIKKLFQRYISDLSGVNALIFAVVLPAMVASAGLAVDLANIYNVKNRLGNALDKTALATANSIGTEVELIQIAENFFAANFREDGLGQAYDIEVVFGEKTVEVSAKAYVDLLFMKMFGQDGLDVSAVSEVTRELSGIEVALVLDVTGSMAGSNMTALKAASTDFLDIMFDRISDADLLRIGIVPYSNAVNVGPYGLGEDVDGSYYGPDFVVRPDTDPYKNPANIDYNPNSNLDWHGCVLAEDYPGDVEDNTASGFGMYRYPQVCTSGWGGYCWSYSSDPNNLCPRTPVVPLTSQKAQLQAAIDDLAAEGNTYGNIGMLWGWRLISPEAPFSEGSAYDDPQWRKAVIMMTDGVNLMHPEYSTYGRTNQHDISTNDLNNRFAEICEAMKEEDVLIYTITFESGVNESTKAFYRNCATVESMYKHAPDSAELENIFRSIANQLSRLHISR